MHASPNHQLRIAADRRDDDRQARDRDRRLATLTPGIEVDRSARTLLRRVSVQPILRRVRGIGHAI
jgi:hypothetical protein